MFTKFLFLLLLANSALSLSPSVCVVGVHLAPESGHLLSDEPQAVSCVETVGKVWEGQRDSSLTVAIPTVSWCSAAPVSPGHC